MRTTVTVDTGASRYEILIGTGVLADPASWDGLPRAALAAIVSNTTVAPLYGAQVAAMLAPRYREVCSIVLPDGEAHKDWRTLDLIFDQLLAHGADRKTVLFALGGGVVGDMAGFAAACFMRGVPFVQLPTTLLAQVDSSVGGKTGINHPRGKNMIGAFHQPRRVLCDLDTLATLPARELSAGLAEVIKYGPIADMGFLDWIEDHLDALLERDPAALAHAVRRSCEVKAEVVGADEKEAGLRAILNFGHTFGHAIEAGMGYGSWLHGEAVAAGAMMAAELSRLRGWLDEAAVARIEAIHVAARLPVRGAALEVARYLELMAHDKKVEDGRLRLVLLQAIGRAVIDGASPPDLIEQAIRARLDG